MADSASDLPIRPLDLTTASVGEWAAFHEFRRARSAESHPDEPVRSDTAVEAQERDPSSYYRSVGWAAWDGSRIVGYVQVRLPHADQSDLSAVADRAYLFGSVRCGWRRRGVGRRLLAEAHAMMAEDGRRLLTFHSQEADGHAFLASIGATETKRHALSHLLLDTVDWALVERWRAALPAGLTPAAHAGRVPLAVYERLLPTVNALALDIPGEWAETPYVPCTLAMIEEWYGELDRDGGEHHMLVLEDAQGAVAALADLSWSPDIPGRASHIFTAVRPDRRGQGLAKALKAAVLLHVREALPGVREMTTGNNEANAPMLAINRQLGFVPYSTGSVWTVGLDALPED